MIRIKFEIEEQEETPLPIESENERIKRILSLKFFGNNLNNSTSDNTNNNGNNNNVWGTLKQKSLLELNGVVPKKVVSEKKPKQLDNSTTDSVAVGSKSIKTEPAESSLSLTTQPNNSLNIQSLLRQNRIQNGWTTNEQSIPIGTQQQQQQSLFSIKIEPIIPGIHQEVPLSLDLSSLSPNLNSEESFNYDTAEIPSLVHSASIPIGTQQQQFLISSKIEPIVSEIHSKEVPLSLDQNSFSILNLNSNSEETTTEFLDSRAGLGRRAKLNVCYSLPIEPKDSVSRRRKKKVSEELPPPPLLTPEPPTTITTRIQRNSSSAFGNSESTINDNYSDQNYTLSGSGSISGVDPSSSTVPSLPPEAAAVPKKPLRRVLLTLEEREARQKESSQLCYQRKKTKLKLMDPEARAKILCKRRERDRKSRQRLLERTEPEQREQIRLKQLEMKTQRLKNENEEQRKRRLKSAKKYRHTVGKQRLEQKRETMTPEEREQKRLKRLERYRREMDKESEERRQRRLERSKQYYNKVGKQRRELKLKTRTPEEREKKRAKNREYYYKYRKNRELKKSLEESQSSMSSSTSMNLVDISESSTSTLNQHLNNHSSSSTMMANNNNNNVIVEIGTIISKRMGKPGKKRFELSMDDSDFSDFDIGHSGGGSGSSGGEESDSQSITTLEHSPKSGPSMKLPRPARCQSNVKSNIYLDPDTDSDDSG